MSYPYELWSEETRSLALTFGAIFSESQAAPERTIVLLDENGETLLEYETAFTLPRMVLSDCEILFGQ